MPDNPTQQQIFSSGVAYDGNLPLLFSNENSGLFVDGHNVEPTSNDGNTGAVQKIKGEVLHYPNTDGNTGYVCIGSWQVRSYLVEVWAPTNPSFPGIIRVNGVIVLESTDFDISPNTPLQGDKCESENFSEITFTDDVVPPYHFDIKDMVDSLISEPDKYFGAFDPELYQVNLQVALDHPVFVELINVGGGGGKPVGQYQYQLRYASAVGDRTQWSHPTPMIPVVQVLNSDSGQYPWVKTVGGPPDPGSRTAFAPKIRFRVTNLNDYDFIEIKCIPYNTGAGLEYTPNGTIVARIDIKPGEISVREYIDPQESNVNVELSPEDESRQLAYIDHCKSIRYFDRRLVAMNITTPSREAELTFLEENEQQGWPIIEKLYKAGHKDPWNHVYRKSEMRGEIVGYGVTLYDGVGNKGFTTKIPQLKNYQFPNRRDSVSNETLTHSSSRVVRAATTATRLVNACHEVFDLGDPVWKNNHCDFKNIVEKGRLFGFTGTKFVFPYGVTDDCDEIDAVIENHGANVSLGLVSTYYHPFHPTRQNDSDVTGHNYVVNTKVARQDPPVGQRRPLFEDESNYRPTGFSPDYYSMGMMVAGIQNFPNWAKSFSVVRTESARRVVCQGVAYYHLTPAEFKFIGNATLGGKEANRFWFYAPDIDNGTVSSDVVNDMIANPQNYSLQFVSPLGFFSEWYTAEDNLFAGKRDRCIDMVSYIRMIRDNGNINPGEAAGMGIDGLDGYRYIDYELWRNTGAIPTTFSGVPDKGNRVFGITAINRVTEGRGTYLSLQPDGDVYAAVTTGGNANFDDAGLKNWTEPVYIVNIIRTGAQINDNDLQKYRQTTHYQKLESIIGKSTGLPDQVFQLVDERWEDCIPSLTNGDHGFDASRYVYVKLTNGTVQKWVNVTYKNPVQVANIQADITAGVGDIDGMYTHTNIGNLGRFFQLNFTVIGNVLPLDSLVMVRYDDTAPIRVFGGDAYISETIFAPLDRASNAKDDEAETQFAFGVGLPYKNFKINPRYYTIRKAGAAVNAIQDTEWFTLGFLRQLVVMFTCETRSAVHLAYNVSGDTDQGFFPAIHYVIRPNRWDYEKSIADNHIFDQYQYQDYGAGEKDRWRWGGFRFKQNVNPDYAIQPPIAFFSKPQFGYEERRHFPTMEMHSLPRVINVQNAPGLKTFPANNSYILDDDQGEIKFGWDATTAKGENLYAICEKGIALFITKKAILSDLDGRDLGYMSSDSFVKHHIWLTKDVGSNDEMWRGIAEASVPLTVEGGAEVRQDALFIPNNQSVFRLMENLVVDIGRIDYHSKVYKEGLVNIESGVQTHVTGAFDKYKQQYYLHMSDGEDFVKTFVFSQKRNRWFGTNSFTFDRFTSDGNKMYGHRDMETYELNSGYTINGAPVIFTILVGFSPEHTWDKEFIRIKVNSENTKPSSIEFYKEKDGPMQCSLDQSLGSLYLKNYRGWTQLIPRIRTAINSARPLFQDTIILAKITHSGASEFVLVNASVEYKKLIMR